jgi:hypothetical protein
MAQKWEYDECRVVNEYGKEVHQCGGGGYKTDQECANYKTYGYNCQGTRRESDGRLLSAPFGFGQKRHAIGPDFGETYAEDHPLEFTYHLPQVWDGIDSDGDGDEYGYGSFYVYSYR